MAVKSSVSAYCITEHPTRLYGRADSDQEGDLTILKKRMACQQNCNRTSRSALPLREWANNSCATGYVCKSNVEEAVQKGVSLTA